jgi:hypothetical protein
LDHRNPLKIENFMDGGVRSSVSACLVNNGIRAILLYLEPLVCVL